MRLIVLDTNVLVSAGINPDGPPAKIVADLVLGGKVQTVTSPAVVEEYREVFRRAKFFRFGFPPLWLEFLIDPKNSSCSAKGRMFGGDFGGEAG